MTKFAKWCALYLVLAATASWATLGDPVPANPCAAPIGRFKSPLAVLDVSGDGSAMPGCANGAFVETSITCTSKERVGKNVDIAIQYFDSSGATITAGLLVGTNAFCGLAPGTTMTFNTRPPAAGPLPGPWGTGATFIPTTPVAAGGPACPAGTPGCFVHGSARVLATSVRVQCSATRIDLSGPCVGLPAPLTSKNLTVIRMPKQKGD
jgi:hypothetical protein